MPKELKSKCCQPIVVDVPGFSGRYSISATGTVWTVRGGVSRSLKPSTDRKGYHRVKLGNPAKEYRVHRLVATAFLPNPDNLPQVNHKDGRKAFNHVHNLEWCTASHNTKEAYRLGLLKSWNKGRKGVYSKESLERFRASGLRRDHSYMIGNQYKLGKKKKTAPTI